MAQVSEQDGVNLSKSIHAFDLKSNEWHIAVLQIYENLLVSES